MRILYGLFGFLLLVNIVYFIWHFGQTDEPNEPPPVPPGIERLQLLDERNGAGDDDGASASADETQAVAMESALARACQSLGVFEDIAATTELSDRIRDLALPPALQDVKYRVYLPSLASREAALQTSRRLAKAGTTDYFIITTDDRRNAISLGVYSQQEGARRRLAQVARLRFKPEAEVCYLETGN